MSSSSNLLIDTNLLILLVAGLTDSRIINRHKRLNNHFATQDFEVLQAILSNFGQLWVTSHCIAEASNLIRQIADPDKSHLMLKLAEILSINRESKVKKRALIDNSDLLIRYGVTDTGLFLKSKRMYVLSVDSRLCDEISHRGWKALNFNNEKMVWESRN